MLWFQNHSPKMKWIEFMKYDHRQCARDTGSFQCTKTQLYDVKNALMSNVCIWTKKTLNELMIDSWKLNDPSGISDVDCETLFNANTCSRTHTLRAHGLDRHQNSLPPFNLNSLTKTPTNENKLIHMHARTHNIRSKQTQLDLIRCSNYSRKISPQIRSYTHFSYSFYIRLRIELNGIFRCR